MAEGATTLQFRPMARTDLPAVLAIERASFQRPWSAASFERELGLAWATVEVAEEWRLAGTRVVGYACIWTVADEVHLMNVAVHPARRRRGVGRRLVERVLGTAAAGGAAAVLLDVRSGNDVARRLYAGVGFRQIGIRRSYYGPGQDALVLRHAVERAS